MSHSSTSSAQTQIDDPVAGPTWVISLSSIIILAALVIATCVFYFRFENIEVDEKVIEPPNVWKAKLKAEQLAQLGVYQKYTVTASNGSEETRIRIPIERAMDLVIAEPAPTPAPTPAPAAGAAAK